MKYGSRADSEIKWGAAPSVVLDLEFVHLGVNVYFSLTLKSFNASIDIHAITFGGVSRSPSENTALLRMALQDARINPPSHLAAHIVAEELRATTDVTSA